MHFLAASFAITLAACTFSSPLQSRTSMCTISSTSNLKAVNNAFITSKLVPDIVSSFSASLLIAPAYGTKAITLGNSFKTTETLTEPAFSITAEANYDPSTTKYTVLLLDPDVPSPLIPLDRTLLGDFNHLIISNVQPECIKIQERVTLRSYTPLTPLSVSQHRYTFLVYRQPANFDPNVILAQDIAGLPLSTFLASSGLEGPVGGNYFLEGLKDGI